MHTGEDSTQEMVEWKRVGGRGNRRREGGRRGEEVGGTYCCGLEAGRGMEEEEEICTFSPGNKLKGVSTPVAEIC